MANLGMIGRPYENCRVLITGDTGFKGSWLTFWLSELGARLTGLSLPPDGERALYATAGLAERIDTHITDLRDAEATQATIKAANPEIIFHLAAQSLVRRSYREPLTTYGSNVMGTVHVLEAARHCPNLKAVVVITTDKVYRTHDGPWPYREPDALGGADPYSASKACAEIVCESWRQSYWQGDGSPLLATTRAGNVIGGGDWAEDRLVPDILRAALNGGHIHLRYPQAVRPWQHVLEPLAGYLLLGERLLAGEQSFARSWNFGPDDAAMQPVVCLCEHLCPALGVSWSVDDTPQPTETQQLRLDSSLARQQLGWQGRWPLAHTLDSIVSWHRRESTGEAVNNLMQEQLAAYCGATP